MDPVTLNVLIGAGMSILGWLAKHYLGGASAPVQPVSPLNPAAPTSPPQIDPTHAALLGLLEKLLADRLAAKVGP